MKKLALVLGAGGFIGSHMVTRLKSEGFWVRGVDLKYPEYATTGADEFLILDLSEQESIAKAFEGLPADNSSRIEIYQYAADMGGAGFIFTGDNDANILHNSATINLNLLDYVQKNMHSNFKNLKIFYSSSACIYPQENQMDPNNPMCDEESAYPANPDSDYGWEKLFSERLFQAYARNFGIPIAIARFHNIYGPQGTWRGGREKAPAAICRKIIEVPGERGVIEVWGDGLQTRSFLYIDECIEASRRLMASDYDRPINIGSEEMVSINQLVEIVAQVAGKKIDITHKLDAPLGVRGRNSSNRLIEKILNWQYQMSLAEGLEKTYEWIENQYLADL